MVHLEGKGGEPLEPDMAGETILIAVKVGYPGSRVSDILIGNEKFQVGNADLRTAYRVAQKWCDENVDGG